MSCVIEQPRPHTDDPDIRNIQSTPWGPAQQTVKVADGIWEVSTASHGGMYLAPWRRKSMPQCLSGPTGYSSDGWFEEDCDWALACASFPHEFGPLSCYYALRHAEHCGDYLKERWAAYLKLPLADELRKVAALHTP